MLKDFLQKKFEYLLYLLAFLLPLQTHYLVKAGSINNQSWEFGNMLLYGTDILLVAIILIGITNKNFEQLKNNKTIQAIKWPVTALIIISASSIIAAPDKILAIYGLVRLTVGLVLFALIVTRNFNKKILTTAVVASAMLQAVWGLIQFFTQNTVANKWLGTSLHESGELGTSVIEVIGPDGRWERWLRAYGGFTHPNVLGGFLAIALVLTLGMIIWQIKRDDISAADKKKFDPYDSLWHLGLVIISTGLFFTFSRSAVLAASLGVLAMVIYNARQWRKLLTPLILIVMTVSACYYHYGYIYQARFVNNSRLETKSNTERVDLIKNSVALISNKDLLGSGINNFGLAVREQIDSRQSSFWYQPVHNVFLLIASEIGILGLLSFLLIMFYLFKNSCQAENYLQIALGLAMLCLMSLDHYLWTSAFGIYLFWLILGLAGRQND